MPKPHGPPWLGCEPPKCGKPHPHGCHGHKMRTDFQEPCGNDPIPGGTVCIFHGGGTPQVAEKAAERVEEQRRQGEIGKLLAEFEGIEGMSHVDSLDAACNASRNMAAALRVMVHELDEPLGHNRFNERVIHPLVALYGEWLDRVTRADKLALDANTDERRTRIQESDTEFLFTAVTTTLGRLGLTPAQMEEFRRDLAAELRKGDAALPSAG